MTLPASTEATTLGGSSDDSAVFALAEAAVSLAVGETELDGADEAAGGALLAAAEVASGAGIAAMLVSFGCGSVVANGAFCAAA